MTTKILISAAIVATALWAGPVHAQSDAAARGWNDGYSGIDRITGNSAYDTGASLGELDREQDDAIDAQNHAIWREQNDALARDRQDATDAEERVIKAEDDDAVNGVGSSLDPLSRDEDQ